MGTRGQVENVPSVFQACRKTRLNGAVSRNNRIEWVAPCRCLDGHVKEPNDMYIAFGARPWVQLLQSAWTSMCRHIYDWNIVDCDVKQPNHIIGIVRQRQLYDLPFAKFRTCGSPCGFLMSFYCDITNVQLFDGPFDCDDIMKKFANRCGVGPFAIRQLRTVV